MFGFAAVRLPPAAGFAESEDFVFGLVPVCGFETDFEADFAGAEALAPVLGFAALGGVFEAEAAFEGTPEFFAAVDLLGAEATLPGVETVFGCTTAFGGSTVLAGTAVFDTTSGFAGFDISFGAGGFVGFFFGGNCSSAKRSMTSSIDCSESA